MMILEKEITQQELFQQMTNWLYKQATKRHTAIEINTSEIEERRGDYYTFIRIPVTIDEKMDAGECATLLTDLQFEWNDQEPRPEKLLFLYPAGVPRYAA